MKGVEKEVDYRVCLSGSASFGNLAKDATSFRFLQGNSLQDLDLFRERLPLLILKLGQDLLQG